MKRLTPKQIEFIEAQPMFFVATAAAEGRVNVSPKGMDTLRVVAADLAIESTASSCGTGVPVMTVDAIRGDEELEPYYRAMSDDEMTDYWRRKNVTSIDGYPTHLFGDG